MNILRKILGLGGWKVKASYDAEKTTSGNREYWKWADNLNADQSNSPGVRERLRDRARYEVANNPWLDGMIQQVASDLVGVMPRLQLTDMDEMEANAIESAWAEWSEAVDLGETLRVAWMTKARDGEAFIQLCDCPALPSREKLYPQLIDCERVRSPRMEMDTDDDMQADGVWFDAFGRPTAYSVAVKHPSVNADGPSVTVPAEYMIHLFNRTRPEQRRGVPMITSALPSVAILRAYTKAMLEKMENSASVAGVLKPSGIDVDPEYEGIDGEPFRPFRLPSRSWVTLPLGYDAQQFEMSTPSDSQQSFALQTKIECARCLLATRNVVTGDSTAYTYASARIDAQNYDRSQRVERGKLEHDCLDKLFRSWWREACPGKETPRHVWFWAGRPPIDPVKDANAEAKMMETGSRTLADVCMEDGRDWQAVTRQLFKEARFRQDMAKEYGVELQPAAQPAEDDKGEEDGRGSEKRD